MEPHQRQPGTSVCPQTNPTKLQRHSSCKGTPALVGMELPVALCAALSVWCSLRCFDEILLKDAGFYSHPGPFALSLSSVWVEGRDEPNPSAPMD